MRLTDAPILKMDYNELSNYIKSLEKEIKRLKEDKCSMCLYGHMTSTVCNSCYHNPRLKDKFTKI